MRWKRSRRKSLQYVTSERQHILARGWIEFTMQQKVNHTKPKLPHLHVGAAEGAGALHLLKQVFGNRFASLVVSRNEVEGFAFHTPVFHDLRWQLHEIPR